MEAIKKQSNREMSLQAKPNSAQRELDSKRNQIYLGCLANQLLSANACRILLKSCSRFCKRKIRIFTFGKQFSVMEKLWVKILFLPLLIASLVFIASLTTTQTDRDGGVDADGRYYISMAGDTTLFPESKFTHWAPFCYRVATPWIASKMPPTNYIAKFRMLATIDAGLMLLMMFLVLQAFGFSYWNSIAGMLLYAGVFWTLKFSFFSSVYIDHMTQWLILLIMWVMAKKWWYLLPILIFGAFFQKESIASLTPFIFAFYLHQKGWKWWPNYVLGFFMLAAVVIPFLILRNNIHQDNAYSSPIYAITESYRLMMARDGYLRLFFVAVYSGLGILPIILLTHLRFVLNYLRTHPYWLVMLGIGLFLLFGGYDKGRLMIYLLPALTVLCVAVFEDLRLTMSRIYLKIWIGLALFLNFFVGTWFMRFRDFDQYLDIAVPEYSGGLGAEGFSRAIIAMALFLLVNFVLRKANYDLA